MKGGSASVASEQSSGRGFGGALRGPLRGQKSKRGCNVFKFCRNKVIHVHTGRTGSVLFTLAEDIVGSGHILSKSSATSTATWSSHDMGSFGRFHVVRFTAAKTFMRSCSVTR